MTWGWLLVEVLQRRLALIIDFELTRNPLYRAWRLVLPDYRRLTAADWLAPRRLDRRRRAAAAGRLAFGLDHIPSNDEGDEHR